MGIRDKMKQSIQDQVKASQSSKDFQPNNFINYFDLNGELEQFVPKKTKEGIGYNFDIIPFEAGPNFPDGIYKSNPPKEGDIVFKVDLFTHRAVGAENATIICPKASFKQGFAIGTKKGCPICEDMQKKQKMESDEEKRKQIWRELKPSRRTLYEIIVRDGGEEEDKGIQVLDTAYFYIQEKLDSLSEDTGDGVITYPDIDDGKKIYAKWIDQGDKQPYKVDAVQFKDRIDPKTKKPYVITDEELEQSKPLDKYLILMSYDEIKEMYEGGLNQSSKSNDEPEENESSDDSEDNVVETPAYTECPHGHEFGADFLNQTECEECENEYFDCEEKSKELKAAKRNNRRLK